MQNFGKIKNAFHEILVESILGKDIEKRKIVKRFIKAISKSEILKSQFLVYNNIENKIDDGQFSANLFITENINLLNKFKKGDIVSENTKLMGLSQMVKLKIDDDYSNKNLHESITSLIFTESTPETVQYITDNRLSIVKYVNENISEDKDLSDTNGLPTSLIANLAVDKFNEKYSNLTEEEHKVLNVILDGGNDEAKKEVFNVVLKECVVGVNNKLSSGDNRVKLLDVKEKLLNTKYNNESFSEDITKLLDLKRTST